ncbi:MAG TPA: metal ABC transporter ATP-binding protein [Dehalococcoidia bacterium]|nr:metal ABC transporter ATP-binding protein [Dehalococcoidia bacterium]
MASRQVQARAPTAAQAVSLSHVSVRLGERLALDDITLSIAPGAFVGLLGPNGSGKSTLLRAILGILPLSQGEVRVEGRDPKAMRDVFSYLPQRQRVDLDTPLRVWDVVMMGRLRHTGWLGRPGPSDVRAVTWALEKVRMSDRRDAPIGQLSFGQQQRVFLARALAQEGRLVLLDEPMNGVDPQTQDLFVELLAEFHEEGKTIVMATHDLNTAACICDTLCVLNRRLVAYGPVSETFRPDVLREAYGTHLHFVEVPSDGHAQVLEDVHHHEGPADHGPGAHPTSPGHTHVHV